MVLGIFTVWYFRALTVVGPVPNAVYVYGKVSVKPWLTLLSKKFLYLFRNVAIPKSDFLLLPFRPIS